MKNNQALNSLFLIKALVLLFLGGFSFSSEARYTTFNPSLGESLVGAANVQCDPCAQVEAQNNPICQSQNRLTFQNFNEALGGAGAGHQLHNSSAQNGLGSLFQNLSGNN